VNDPYADAILYDLEYADHVEDLAHYVDRARTAGGRVLELGCGSGRLTLPIARAGVHVLGVDRAPSMLDAARRKLAAEPAEVQGRVELAECDYHSLRPDLQFAAVLWPFNALHHCADEDALAVLLERMHDWLAPAGRLALDCYLPDRELYDRDPEGRYEAREFVDPTSGAKLLSWEQGWWDAAARVHHVMYVYQWPDGTERRTHLQLRMFELAELLAIFARTGWKVARAAEDFRGTPVGPRALKWVGVLRKALPPVRSFRSAR
jgi:SAM-dependent methyltransferase